MIRESPETGTWTKQKGADWSEPTAIWSADGRMIAIPYHEWNYNGENEISVFVVNAKSAYLAPALRYAKHYIKTKEWSVYRRYTQHTDREKLKAYYKRAGQDTYGILKADMDW